MSTQSRLEERLARLRSAAVEKRRLFQSTSAFSANAPSTTPILASNSNITNSVSVAGEIVHTTVKPVSNFVNRGAVKTSLIEPPSGSRSVSAAFKINAYKRGDVFAGFKPYNRKAPTMDHQRVLKNHYSNNPCAVRLQTALISHTPVLLHGPPGTGKSSSVYRVARALRRTVKEVNASECTTAELAKPVYELLTEKLPDVVLLLEEVDGCTKPVIANILSMTRAKGPAVVMTANRVDKPPLSGISILKICYEAGDVASIEAMLSRRFPSVPLKLVKQCAATSRGDYRKAVSLVDMNTGRFAPAGGSDVAVGIGPTAYNTAAKLITASDRFRAVVMPPSTDGVNAADDASSLTGTSRCMDRRGTDCGASNGFGFGIRSFVTPLSSTDPVTGVSAPVVTTAPCAAAHRTNARATKRAAALDAAFKEVASDLFMTVSCHHENLNVRVTDLDAVVAKLDLLCQTDVMQFKVPKAVIASLIVGDMAVHPPASVTKFPSLLGKLSAASKSKRMNVHFQVASAAGPCASMDWGGLLNILGTDPKSVGWSRVMDALDAGEATVEDVEWMERCGRACKEPGSAKLPAMTHAKKAARARQKMEASGTLTKNKSNADPTQLPNSNPKPKPKPKKSIVISALKSKPEKQPPPSSVRKRKRP
jgi:DNA polymerase III delta prime subunit